MGSIRSFARGFLSSKPGMVMALVAALVGTTTIGFAAATTAGVIYACVNSNSGTLKIVSASDTCPTNWTALSWNQQGPIGLTGATGPAGPQGATGAVGTTGPTGATGAMGPQGVTGPTGAQGPEGPQGRDGALGPQGATGTNGNDGASVASVAVGSGDPNCPFGGSQFTVAATTTYACNGAAGAAGATGATGPSGAAGPTGPSGAGGLTGYEIVHVSQDFRSPNGLTTGSGPVRAYCPVGKVVLGGSYILTGVAGSLTSGVFVPFDYRLDDRPDYDGTRYSWLVLGKWVTDVYAACANGS